jgi:ketosteroid isomerase-like protein
MSLLRRAVTVVGTCSVLACQPGAEAFSDSERQGVTAAVTAGMISYAEALGALDSARVLGHYVASPEFRLASDGNSYSHSDMKTVLGGLRAKFQSLDVRWDTLVVTVLDRDAAFVYAPFRRTDTDLAGGVARIRGNATWVWVRRNGSWRMLYGHGDHYPDTAAAR